MLAKSEVAAKKFEYMLPFGSYACETTVAFGVRKYKKRNISRPPHPYCIR